MELGSAKAAIRYFISPVAPIGGGGEWRGRGGGGQVAARSDLAETRP